MRDSEIYMKVRDFVVANRLLDGTHRVITGFSGGADSVCLLFILKALQKEEDLPDFSLVAMHIHHGIRGDEADRDAAFAKDFCKKLDIDYIDNHIDVPAAAKTSPFSLKNILFILRVHIIAPSIPSSLTTRLLPFPIKVTGIWFFLQ